MAGEVAVIVAVISARAHTRALALALGPAVSPTTRPDGSRGNDADDNDDDDDDAFRLLTGSRTVMFLRSKRDDDIPSFQTCGSRPHN